MTETKYNENKHENKPEKSSIIRNVFVERK